MTVLPMPTSTYQLLHDAAHAWPDAVATQWIPDPVRYTDCLTWTYSELAARVTQIANALTWLGVGRADAVTLCGVNTSDVVRRDPGRASRRHRCTGQPDPERGTPDAADPPHRIPRRGGGRTGARRGAVGTPPGRVRRRRGGRGTGAAARRRHRRCAAAAHRRRQWWWRTWTTWPPHSQPTGWSGLSRRRRRTWPHSSTLEGRPVPRRSPPCTHANQLTCGRGIAAACGLRPGEAMLGGLPLFHVNALLVTGIAPMFAGARVVWPGPAGYRDKDLYACFWKLVEHHRIVAMSAVPTVYATLARVPVDADISSLRLPVVGASPLPPSVRDDFAAHTGRRLLEGLRPDRGHLRQHVHPARRGTRRLGRPAAARAAGEGGSHRRGRVVDGPLPRRGRHPRHRRGEPCSPGTSPTRRGRPAGQPRRHRARRLVEHR